MNNYIKEHLKNSQSRINRIEYFAVNNSALFYFGDTKKQPLKNNLKTEIPKGNLVVALLDSGVSTNHEKLVDFNVIQFNSKDNSYGEKDSGLGHATGILSLLNLKENANRKNINDNVTYLSCNGITDGKYDFISALRCFNWLFQQPQVDVMLNAWLVSEPGCKPEWN
ncbi:MAG: S8/S53 family peptidase, partial [Kangiellaceae bacterium]|nr:S8/S53 family peptidase [Kangiellaceae bacterium]